MGWLEMPQLFVPLHLGGSTEGPADHAEHAEKGGPKLRLNPQPFHAVDMTTDGENDTDEQEQEKIGATGGDVIAG